MTPPRLFVYYRLPAAVAADAALAVQAAQRQLRERVPGLQAEVLRRPTADAQGTLTLMETYARPGDGIATALQATIEAALREALAPWLAADARHAEVFEPLDADTTPCAS